ncbi:MAG: efflux RND transporter periplasmic adaptor subunit [Planctomycetes bacterium]|nr:efflux RND transporter periplasmic adaptor subunit [Planctomycetota bacterium]
MTRFMILTCLAVLMACTGCQRGGPKVTMAEAVAYPVSTPIEREVSDYLEYTGRTNAKDSVIIQPRVTGYLMKMPFREGADVKKGDILFEIDDRPYQAQLKAAEAAVAQNKAGLEYAKETNEQFKAIKKELKDAVTQRELNQYAALERQAKAGLDFAEANLVSAKLNLEWCTVKSPIDGRISRYFMTAGNLVNQDVTQLTTVVSINPMYVYFDMDEPTLVRIRKAISEGQVTPPRFSVSGLPFLATSTFGLLATPSGDAPWVAASASVVGADAPVEMGLQGDPGYPYRGYINFIDNQVNPGTGSISVRGEFQNPRLGKGTYLLAPGMFVRVRLPVGQPQQQLLVIDKAITSQQGRKQVFVVNADNKVEARPVAVGALQEDGLRVITSGLKKEDRVLTGGLQQVQEGMTIQTELGLMPTVTPATTPLDKDTKKKGGKN